MKEKNSLAGELFVNTEHLAEKLAEEDIFSNSRWHPETPWQMLKACDRRREEFLKSAAENGFDYYASGYRDYIAFTIKRDGMIKDQDRTVREIMRLTRCTDMNRAALWLDGYNDVLKRNALDKLAELYPETEILGRSGGHLGFPAEKAAVFSYSALAEYLKDEKVYSEAKRTDPDEFGKYGVEDAAELLNALLENDEEIEKRTGKSITGCIVMNPRLTGMKKEYDRMKKELETAAPAFFRGNILQAAQAEFGERKIEKKDGRTER